MPTYKYQQGTNKYDKTGKCRVPAWTDRVLFSETMPTMTLMKYNRAECTISDHKPVFAHFKVKINKIDHDAKALVEENLIAKYHAIAMNNRAQQQEE